MILQNRELAASLNNERIMMAIFRNEFDLEVSMSITTYVNKWIAETLKVFYGSGRRLARSQPIGEVQIPAVTNYIYGFLRQITKLRMINLVDLCCISYLVYEGKESIIITGYDFGVDFGLVIKSDGTIHEEIQFFDWRTPRDIFQPEFKSVFANETQLNYLTGQFIRERSLTKHSDEIGKLVKESYLIAELKIDFQGNQEKDFIYSARFTDNKLHECRVEDLKVHSSEGLRGRDRKEIKSFKSRLDYYAYRENIPYELFKKE